MGWPCFILMCILLTLKATSMKDKKTITILTLLFVLIPVSIHAGSLTFNTYLPSPTDAYDRLRLTPRSTLPTPCDIGSIYVELSGSVKVCNNDGGGSGVWGFFSGVWTQTGDDLYPTDTASNPDLKIGIGTTEPEGRLHIEVDGTNVNWGSSSNLIGDVIIADIDAVLNLVGKNNAGSVGESALLFSEVNPNGNYIDTWALGREESGEGSDLFCNSLARGEQPLSK